MKDALKTILLSNTIFAAALAVCYVLLFAPAAHADGGDVIGAMAHALSSAMKGEDTNSSSGDSDDD